MKGKRYGLRIIHVFLKILKIQLISCLVFKPLLEIFHVQWTKHPLTSKGKTFLSSNVLLSPYVFSRAEARAKHCWIKKSLGPKVKNWFIGVMEPLELSTSLLEPIWSGMKKSI